MRFDDRVTGNPKTYAPNAKKIHVEIDPSEIGKNVKVDVPLVGDMRDVLDRHPAQGRSPSTASAWLRHIHDLKGDAAVRDISNLPDNGHLYAAHVMQDLWRETGGRHDRRHRRRPAPDVGGAVLPPRSAPLADHVRRPRHDGLRPAGGHRRQDGHARRGSVGRRRRRRLPDDDVRAGDASSRRRSNINIAIINNGYLGMVRQLQEFFYQRRYAATPLVNPDFCKLAEAYGLAAVCGRAAGPT